MIYVKIVVIGLLVCVWWLAILWLVSEILRSVS